MKQELYQEDKTEALLLRVRPISQSRSTQFEEMLNATLLLASVQKIKSLIGS